MAPPPPVMQNVGMTFMLGMGEALGAGIKWQEVVRGDGLKLHHQINKFDKVVGGRHKW